MIREIILHAGLAKTGTSALQAFLFANKQHLIERYGLLYPGDHENHYHLQSMVSEAPEAVIQVRREGITEREPALQFARGYRDAITEELRNTTADRIVFSTEYLAASSHSEKLAIFAFLREITPNIRVIVYLRDPWSFAISHTQQGIRDGLLFGDVSLGYAWDTIETIKSFEAASDIVPTVRPYVPAIEKIDVINDFLTLLDIGEDDPQLVRPPQDRSNTSLSFQAGCLLAAFNNLFPAKDSNGLYKVDEGRDWASEVIQRINGDRPRLSRATAAQIYEESFEHMKEVQDTYLGGVPVYWDAYEKMEFHDAPDAFSTNNVSKDEIVSSLCKAVYELGGKCIELRKWALHAKAEADRLRGETAHEI